MDVSPVIVVGGLAGLVGLLALVAAVRRVAKGRRSHELGPVSGEWLSERKVRDRRDD
jgi:hypothetical protein